MRSRWLLHTATCWRFASAQVLNCARPVQGRAPVSVEAWVHGLLLLCGGLAWGYATCVCCALGSALWPHLAAEARASRMRQGREKKQWAGMRSHQCAPLRNALTLLVRREEEMGLSVGGTKGITCVVARACAASTRARDFSRGCWWHVPDEVRTRAASDLGELCRNGCLSATAISPPISAPALAA